MSVPTTTTETARIESVEVSAYEIPTATEMEADGTLEWNSTTIVVVQLACGGHTGLGYTYCHPAAGEVIKSKLADLLEGCDAMMPEKAWAQMQVQSRQLGHEGIAAMAISFGIKSPLDYSVFSAAAGAVLLALISRSSSSSR